MLSLVAYLAAGLVLLWILRHFVYAPVFRGQMAPWLGALLSGAVWASVPILLVFFAGGGANPAILAVSGLLFISAAGAMLVGAKFSKLR